MSASVSAKVKHPLLVLYLAQLAKNPLRTKAITAATFSFLQEVIGSNAAGLPPNPTSKDASVLSKALARLHIDAMAFKMALQGFLVSAPLGHFLAGLLQKAFAGKVGLKYRLGQLLASNLLIAPIQTTAFLASMAVINGAKSVEEIIRTVRAGFFAAMQASLIISPLSMVIAQKFVPVEFRVLFFNFVQFALGTSFNIWAKRLRLAAAKKEKEQKERERVQSAAAEAK